jgi:hypothetical protein
VGENALADEKGLLLRQIALAVEGEGPIEVFDDHELENGVAEKLEPLVRPSGVSTVAAEERAVSERLLQDGGVPETNSRLGLERGDHVRDAFGTFVRLPMPPEPRKPHPTPPTKPP